MTRCDVWARSRLPPLLFDSLYLPLVGFKDGPLVHTCTHTHIRVGVGQAAWWHSTTVIICDPDHFSLQRECGKTSNCGGGKMLQMASRGFWATDALKSVTFTKKRQKELSELQTPLGDFILISVYIIYRAALKGQSRNQPDTNTHSTLLSCDVS